jgi:hypothetical protein
MLYPEGGLVKEHNTFISHVVSVGQDPCFVLLLYGLKVKSYLLLLSTGIIFICFSIDLVPQHVHNVCARGINKIQLIEVRYLRVVKGSTRLNHIRI